MQGKRTDYCNSPGPCVRKIVLVGILWTLKFLCRNLQFKWCWIEKKLSAIFSEPFRPVLCKLDMTSLYSWWMTTKCLQFDSRLFESNIINAFTTAVYITFWLFQGMNEWTKYLKQDTRVFISETSFLFSSYLLHLLMKRHVFWWFPRGLKLNTLFVFRLFFLSYWF